MLQQHKVYLLDKPDSKCDVDLARPGYWELIQFDEAPFMFQGRTKISEDGKSLFKYLWAEWVVAGYINSIEHVVAEENVEQYESRWKVPDDEWLKTVQTVIYRKLVAMKEGAEE